MAPIGISVERSNVLRCLDPSWEPWCNTIRPDWTVELRPLNESLTRWVATRYYPAELGDRIRQYDVIIHTPPGRPEWLELMDENAA